MKKTVISITKKTPAWATWVFRIVFVLTGAAFFIIAGDKAIPADIAVRIGVYLTAIDRAVWALGRMLGVAEDVSQWQNK